MHLNEANITFPCAFDTCKREFRTYSAFKSHVFRDHVNDSTKHKNTSVLNVGEAYGMLHCSLGFCGKHVESLQDLIKHLKYHIMQGNEIICPFQNCGMKYSVKSSFSSHLSRRHKGRTNQQLLPALVTGGHSSSMCNESETPHLSTSNSNGNNFNADDCNSDMSDDDRDMELFLKNLALFYLKLSSKYHMPASTIQMVIEEIHAVHNVSQQYLKMSVSKKLKENSISEAVINEIINLLLSHSHFNVSISISFSEIKVMEKFLKNLLPKLTNEVVETAIDHFEANTHKKVTATCQRFTIFVLIACACAYAYAYTMCALLSFLQIENCSNFLHALHACVHVFSIYYLAIKIANLLPQS